ncbi:carboxypeptidase-like regulatory domain-containing protein, partial [Rhizobium ruizarguesonis]
ANVVVLSAKDSAFVVGTITDEKGKFRVDKAAVGDILKVSFIGYEPYVTTLNTLDALTIVLKEDAHLMSEVVVKGNVPQHKLTI